MPCPGVRVLRGRVAGGRSGGVGLGPCGRRDLGGPGRRGAVALRRGRRRRTVPGLYGLLRLGTVRRRARLLLRLRHAGDGRRPLCALRGGRCGGRRGPLPGGPLRRDGRSPVVRGGGGLGPVVGVPVHRGDGQTAADDGDCTRDDRAALVLLPAGQLAATGRPPHLPRGRPVRVIDVRGTGVGTRKGRGCGGEGGFDGGRGPGGARPRARGVTDAAYLTCVLRAPGIPADVRVDVRGVGAAPGAHQGAVEVPTT